MRDTNCSVWLIRSVCCVVSATVLSLAGCSGRIAVETGPILPAPTPVVLPIQHGFGGRVRETISLGDAELDGLRARFGDPADAAAERAAIGRCVAMLEALAGTQTPVHRDLAMNAGSGAGKLDCIDESANTTVWLRLLAGMGLLRHHDVGVLARRSPRLVDNHRSAVIVERGTGLGWVVDSWFGPNGAEPRIEPLAAWLRG